MKPICLLPQHETIVILSLSENYCRKVTYVFFSSFLIGLSTLEQDISTSHLTTHNIPSLFAYMDQIYVNSVINIVDC